MRQWLVGRNECRDYNKNYAIMRVTNAGIQLIILVACPRLVGRNWKVLASPCRPNSSRAFRWIRLGPGVTSSVSVDDEFLSMPSREFSCSATRNMFDMDRMMDALHEFANVSLIRSCRPSYLEGYQCGSVKRRET